MNGQNLLSLLLAAIFFFFCHVQGAPPPATPGGIRARAPGKPPFVWRGETGKTRDGKPGRSPADVQRAGGMWARGFQLIDQLSPEQLEAGSGLWTHTNNPGGTRDVTQYVSTSTSLIGAITFAVRPSPEHAQEVGYLYRIRTNWAMVDVNLSLENISPYPEQQEQAAVQGIPWNQILGWYEVRAADLNRILGAEDPISQLGRFTRNPDFRPDSTDPSGAQPQLAGLQNPVEGRHGAWEAYVGQSVASNLRQFIREYGPQTEAADQTTLSSLDWSAVEIPGHLRTALGQGAASAAQCAMALAAVVVSWHHDELKRSIPWHKVDGRDTSSSLSNNACGRLATAVKDKAENKEATVKICDEPQSGGECLTIQTPPQSCVGVPLEWNDRASTILLSASAGICQFFHDYNCAGASFQSSFPGNDRLDEFDEGRFNNMISSIRCDNTSPETQIDRPPVIEVAKPDACIAKPRPLAEILWVMINNIDGENPGDLFGSIHATDDSGRQVIYNVEKDDSVSVEPRVQITLRTSRPLAADGNFVIDLDLWDRDRDASPHDEVSRGQIAWKVYDPANEYDTPIQTEVDGEYGKATVDYVVMSSATQAVIQVIMLDGDGEKPADVFGRVRASSRFVQRDLFNREGGDSIEVYPDTAIPLSRAIMAVPMLDTLKIHVDLWDHDADWSPNDQIAYGVAEFRPQLSGSEKRVVDGEYGKVEVSVTWGGDQPQGC
ncbi:Heat-labile enterotoxin IIA, A chain [Metarhizium guizhouense ARSEF 977]|uniref:Heat-labile enterotoxin IIA, A chain n=1 Tax=Metarhizium guizhouense (strain ARSEF 977) TaxID=1276136 RepID=A0A0B4GKS5_METGA|nr:Heat-labile enterotoxin IIA, A chain [Metarhizium guizhouense ARSEF 977]